jgi:hypothetical protein
MMKRTTVLIAVVVGLAGGLFLVCRGRLLAAAGGPPTQSPAVVKILELVQGQRFSEHLAGGALQLPGAGGTGASRLPVTLSRTEYRCRYTITQGGATHERSDQLLCYELDGGAAYHWAIWQGGLSGCWALLANGPGANYLACAMGTGIAFVEVSKPRDRQEALRAFLTHFGAVELEPGITWVDVWKCVPHMIHWGMNAFYNDIVIRAIRSVGTDTWEVEFSNPDGSQVYTMVKDGPNTKWRLK